MIEVLRSIPEGLLMLLRWDYLGVWLIVVVVALAAARVGLMLPVLYLGTNTLCATAARAMFGIESRIDWQSTDGILDRNGWGIVILSVIQSVLTSAIVRKSSADDPTAPDNQANYQVRDSMRALIRVMTISGSALVCVWALPSGVVSGAHSKSLFFGIPACVAIWLATHFVMIIVQIPFFMIALKCGMDRFSARGFVEGPLFVPISLLPLYSYARWVALQSA